MNVEQFLGLLEAHPQQALRIVLPNGEAVASHFHITEVGHVSKNFLCWASEIFKVIKRISFHVWNYII